MPYGFALPSTAVFSVMMLGREISSAKWRALSLLVVACILVASPSFSQCLCDDDDVIEGVDKVSSTSSASGRKQHSMVETLLGVGCIMIMTSISGFSAAYFESMLKTETEGKVTIWERNFQLALYSSFLLALVVIYDLQNAPGSQVVFFEGWTLNTIIIALIQALGGLLVAVLGLSEFLCVVCVVVVVGICCCTSGFGVCVWFGFLC